MSKALKKKGKGKGKKKPAKSISPFPSVFRTAPSLSHRVSTAPSFNSLYAQVQSQAHNLLTALPIRRDIVFIDLRCVDWSFGNIEIITSVNASLSVIAHKLHQTYGSLRSIHLYRSSPIPANELLNMSQTFSELGCVGGSRAEKNSYFIYYDFTPILQNAVISREPYNWMNIFTSNSDENRESISRQQKEDVLTYRRKRGLH